jgi:hypothetical protein
MRLSGQSAASIVLATNENDHILPVWGFGFGVSLESLKANSLPCNSSAPGAYRINLRKKLEDRKHQFIRKTNIV